jgi:FkbM family methyltransferase
MGRAALGALASLPAHEQALRDARAQLQAATDRLTSTQHYSPGSASHYLGGNRGVVTTAWGYRLLLRTDDFIVAPELMTTGIYEPGLTALLPRLLRPNETMLDLGANIGYYSVLAASVVGAGGFVVAVEAVAELAAITRLNLISSGMANSSHIANVAAYSHTTELEFFERIHAAANSSLGEMTEHELAQFGDSQRTIRVPAVDLDTYLAGILHGKPAPALVKIDVEGAEYFAMQGARNLLSGPHTRVLLEWSPGQQRRAGADPALLLSLIEDLGFHVSLTDARTDALHEITVENLGNLDYANVLLTHHGEALTAR